MSKCVFVYKNENPMSNEHRKEEQPGSDQAGKTADKMRTEIADFIHESMCIDGFVKFENFESITVISGKKIKGMLFEVTDKKRGKFYIGWYYDAQLKQVEESDKSQPVSVQVEGLRELCKEAKELIVKLLSPEEFEEDYDCERLYDIIQEIESSSGQEKDAVGFARWIRNHCDSVFDENDNFVWETDVAPGEFTDEQLYTLYLNRDKK